MTSSDSSSGYGELSGQDLLHQLFKINHLLQRQFEMGLVSYGLPEQLTGPRLRVLLEISAAGKIRMNEAWRKIWALKPVRLPSSSTRLRRIIL